MRVKDRETGLIYESDNDFVIAQWDKNPERYVKPKEKGTVNQPVNTPNIPNTSALGFQAKAVSR